MKSSWLKIVVVVSLLSGCVSVPDKLSVEETTTLTPFTAAKAEPQANIGNMARWGGVIASVSNSVEHTMLEVVHFPLTSSTRPLKQDETQGRFRVYYKGLLDPVIYKEGRSITTLGTIGQMEDGKIGELEYQYPVIKADAVHLWKDIKQVDVDIIHSPYWASPYYWYQPRFYHPHNRRIIIRNSTSSGSKPAVNKRQVIDKK